MVRILIISLLLYFAFRAFSSIFRLLFGVPETTGRGRNFRETRRQPGEGNVNIDYVPEDDKKRSEKRGGGDYVDFEEVK